MDSQNGQVLLTSHTCIIAVVTHYVPKRKWLRVSCELT